jgi:hypothetical protein
MIECNTAQTQNVKKEESSKDNKSDQRYITCTHIDKEWGKDFAGTNEPVALCTPPWPVLREALFGIVQSMKDDDKELSNEKENENSYGGNTNIAPVDIAYVVVVSATARVKKTKPQRRSMLSNTILSKFEDTTISRSTVTSMNSTNNNNETIKVDDTGTSSTSLSYPPRYKLLIDDEDDDVDDENNTNNIDVEDVSIFDTTKMNQRCRNSMVEMVDDIVSSSPLSTPQPVLSPTTETTRPTFRLCFE